MLVTRDEWNAERAACFSRLRAKGYSLAKAEAVAGAITRATYGPQPPKPPLWRRLVTLPGRIKEMLMLKKLLMLAVGLVLFGASAVLAQDVAPPDYRKLIAESITVLVPVFTMTVLWLTKLAWSKIPASVVVFAAPVVGILGNFLLASITGNQTSDPIVAALLGMAGTYLREILSTLTAKGLAGGITVTKGGL